MEPQDKEELKKKSVQVTKLFDAKVFGTTTNETIVNDADVEKVAAMAHKNFLDKTAKDLSLLKKEMIRDAEALIDYYLWVITLLFAWSDLNEKEVKKKEQISPEKLLSGDFNFSQNSILKLLEKVLHYKWAYRRKMFIGKKKRTP